MFKRSTLYQSMLLALVLPGVAMADTEIEIGGYIKNETAVFTKDGQVTGKAQNMLDDEGHSSGDLLKFENSLRLFFNGDLGEESSWHGDLNIVYDTEAIDGYKGHEWYTQNDWLRELYIDTNAWGWDFRLGKQQVVWGTADGIKLLDIINPTDFRELNQNAMEDSRIPIWMINAETNVGNNGNVQLIISQAEENKIPGLNEDGDAGHAFLMKGVDSISGQVNGFRNITPALSEVAANFTNAAVAGFFGGNQFDTSGLTGFTGVSVDGFASTLVKFYDPFGTPDDPSDDFALLPGLTAFDGLTTYDGGPIPVAYTMPGAIALNNITQNGLFAGDPNANNNVTNLMPVTGEAPSDTSWVPNDSSSAFEYMSNATYATFNSFSGINSGTPGVPAGIKTTYVRDYPNDTDPNAGGRYKGSTDGGFNFSLNYFYHYSANPTINLSWHDSVTGEELQVIRANALDENMDGMPDFADTNAANSVDVADVPGSFSAISILLNNSNNEFYGKFDPNPFAAARDGHTMSSNDPELRFTETVHRVHSIGASFDYAMDAGFSPIVFRGEFLYDKDDKQPVVNKKLLAIGDLSNGLKMEDADYFKYVLGADITVFTNMLVSGQFIQFWNLDYIDDSETCTTQGDLTLGGTGGVNFDCSSYSADFATLNMSNGLNKGYENKEFYSLFFSKPFGSSQQHRWNNITIYEEGGGWWNRLDAEFSATDSLILTGEWNNYWGDEDTTFGQFDKSSNLQVGLKWIFE